MYELTVCLIRPLCVNDSVLRGEIMVLVTHQLQVIIYLFDMCANVWNCLFIILQIDIVLCIFSSFA